MSEELSRVRRAYEVGRLRGALPWLLAPALLSLLSCTCCVARAELVVLTVSLAALLVGFAWRGGAAGAAAKAGLAAPSVRRELRERNLMQRRWSHSAKQFQHGWW